MLRSEDIDHHFQGHDENPDTANACRHGLPPRSAQDTCDFRQALAENNITLNRGQTTTLQINVGLLCNMICRHCHLEAGPLRREIMTRQTMDQVTDLASRHCFSCIDITGGAPEMNPHIAYFLKQLAPLTPTLILRSNLTAISEKEREPLIDLCCRLKVTLVASFPSLNEEQTAAQRGDGAFNRSIETIRKLNNRGYGKRGTGLLLNLVSNPAGAFLPSPQGEQEKRFREVLWRNFTVEFNNLYTFANAPLGRFRGWLEKSGNLDGYMAKLAKNFNPCAADQLMCRNLLSVAWDGYLYDCDFNQSIGLGLGGRRIHISDLSALPPEGSDIALADHCYTCTAGAGFT